VRDVLYQVVAISDGRVAIAPVRLGRETFKRIKKFNREVK